MRIYKTKVRTYKTKEALLRAIERKKEQIYREEIRPIRGRSPRGLMVSKSYLLALQLEELEQQLKNFE